MQQGHAGSLVNAAALGFDNAVLDLVGHAEPMASTNRVRLGEQGYRIGKLTTVQGHRHAFRKAHADRLGLHHDIFAPERHAHDGLDNANALVQELQVLRFVSGAKQVRVSGIGLLGAHAVVETRGLHVLRHLLAATEFIDEALVQPGFVDAQPRVGQQAVAVEALDVIALEGAAVAPDVHVIFAHGHHQHGASHRAAQRCRVEVSRPARGHMESTALDGGKAFRNQLRPAFHQPRALGAITQRATRNIRVVSLVRLTKVRRVGIGHRAFGAHPVQRGAGVEPAGKRYTHALAYWQTLQNVSHGKSPSLKRLA